jgi:hypothetical protein
MGSMINSTSVTNNLCVANTLIIVNDTYMSCVLNNNFIPGNTLPACIVNGGGTSALLPAVHGIFVPSPACTVENAKSLVNCVSTGGNANLTIFGANFAQPIGVPPLSTSNQWCANGWITVLNDTTAVCPLASASGVTYFINVTTQGGTSTQLATVSWASTPVINKINASIDACDSVGTEVRNCNRS